MKKILVFMPVAGKATRMYPISLEIPKHQLPIYEIPLEQYIIENVYSISKNKYDINVVKNEGDEPKGTAWSLKKIPFIETYDNVIVWYGDIYSELNLEEMLTFHENKNSDLTILSQPVKQTEYKKGLFMINEQKRILDFYKGTHYKGYNFFRQLSNKFSNPHKDVGILIISKKGIDYILNLVSPKNIKEYDLSTHVFPKMVKELDCFAYVSDVFTHDIGTMLGYLKVICHVRGLNFEDLKKEMNK